jgi:hypothetical protein
VLRACVAIERAGLPTVGIVSSEFSMMAGMIARALGVADVPIGVYPGVIMADSDAVFEEKVRAEVVPALIDGLTRTVAGAREERVEAFEPRAIVARGTFDEVQDLFHERHWTDGMPVVPPTPERVAAFLAHTDRSPDEVLGTLLPGNVEATVWNTAVNGVMAGCRPEYLPVLLAVVEALADPTFKVQDAGSTPGWEPLVTVSGPVVAELGFNSGTGVMRVGNRANTSIGRFVRLYLRNVAGLRPQPDETDKGAIATTFNVALPENAEAVAELGWTPHQVDRGFAATDSVVTVRSVVTISAPIYSAGARAEDHLATIARVTAEAIGPWAYHSYVYGQQFPLVVIGPGIARAIAAGGYGKAEVSRYLYEHVVVDGAWVAHYGRGASGKRFQWAELAAAGKAPAEYADAEETGRMVRAFLSPESIDVVVAGNPGRNQSRAYIENHAQGVPVSKRIRRRR